MNKITFLAILAVSISFALEAMDQQVSKPREVSTQVKAFMESLTPAERAALEDAKNETDRRKAEALKNKAFTSERAKNARAQLQLYALAHQPGKITEVTEKPALPAPTQDK